MQKNETDKTCYHLPHLETCYRNINKKALVYIVL